jgi:hypothetical protein
LINLKNIVEELKPESFQEPDEQSKEIEKTLEKKLDNFKKF